MRTGHAGGLGDQLPTDVLKTSKVQATGEQSHAGVNDLRHGRSAAIDLQVICKMICIRQGDRGAVDSGSIRCDKPAIDDFVVPYGRSTEPHNVHEFVRSDGSEIQLVRLKVGRV